ncbi:MAG: hypothetical protein RLZZ164_48 [Actinomycetota bacterium]
MEFFQKIAIINSLIGEDAPLRSKLRAYIHMDARLANLDAAVDLALQAIRFDAYGFGWNTVIVEQVAGPGSPTIEHTVGQVIDRFDLLCFLQDTPDNGRLESADWHALVGN